VGKFLVRRVAQAVFVLLVTSFGALVAVTEWGDPFKMIGPRMQTPETRAVLNETFGLDQPLVIRYLHFVANLFTGDLGVDFRQRRPIIDLIMETAPNSLRLALAAIVIQIVVGTGLGIVAAWRRHTFADLVITTFAVVVTSIPLFVIGVVLRDTLTGVSLFGWQAFPLIPRSIGVETTWLQNMALPAIALGTGALAFTVTLTRGSMFEVLEADYIRTARAKGLTERKVVFKHAARNALIPVAELSAIQLGALMGGSIIVEAIFQYPGVGYLFVRAMAENNHPVMLAVAAYSVTLFVIVLMIADLLTAWLDPRIRTVP
jgi:oligopeptide transport system permease protein